MTRLARKNFSRRRNLLKKRGVRLRYGMWWIRYTFKNMVVVQTNEE